MQICIRDDVTGGVVQDKIGARGDCTHLPKDCRSKAAVKIVTVVKALVITLIITLLIGIITSVVNSILDEQTSQQTTAKT